MSQEYFEFRAVPQGTSLRREVKMKCVWPPDAPGPIYEPVVEEIVVLSPEESIDSVRLEHERPLDCFCLAVGPPAGWCFCGRRCCRHCFGHCFGCRVGLCNLHSRVAETAQGRVRLCRRCHEQMKRRRLVRGIARALLGPFIEFRE